MREGIVEIPSAIISVLMLGPGTSLTHRAVELISDAGMSIVWVGENGLKYLASGKPLTTSSNLLIKQAELVSNQRKHLAVVRKMYEKRFPGEDMEGLTLQQLRGKEGSRVRAEYKKQSDLWGIPWTGRSYKAGSIQSSDLVNQCLTIGNSCLYGLAHSVIEALGCSAGLGFIHVGHEKSFVYDLADLYKSKTTIPVAFEIASQKPANVYRAVRTKLRSVFVSDKILTQMVEDIYDLFAINDGNDLDKPDIALWDKSNLVSSGVGYGE